MTLLNRHQVGGVSRSPDGLFAQQEREPIRGRPAVRGKRTYSGRPGQRVEEQGTWASHTQTQRGRLRTACGQRCVDSKNSQTTPATASTSSVRQLLGAADAQTAHHVTSSTAPTHQLLGSANAETTPARSRPQRLTERSDPTQHAKGRTGDCPGPRKGATTRRNVTQGGLGRTQPHQLYSPLMRTGTDEQGRSHITLQTLLSALGPH